MGPPAPWGKLKSRYASNEWVFAFVFRVKILMFLKMHYIKNCGVLTNSQVGMRGAILVGGCQPTSLACVPLGFASVMRYLVHLRYHVGSSTTQKKWTIFIYISPVRLNNNDMYFVWDGALSWFEAEWPRGRHPCLFFRDHFKTACRKHELA